MIKIIKTFSIWYTVYRFASKAYPFDCRIWIAC